MGRSPLYVAAGGGGDAIAAAMVHRAMGAQDRPLIASFSWDRLLVDPLPGPRGATDFQGLEPVGSVNYRLQGKTEPVAPAGSLLPRLARELDADVFLMDPSQGAAGLGQQLEELANLYAPDGCQLIDVGGDVLAVGDEPELRSPLADSLALAAVARVWPNSEVLVTGPGLDAELSPADVVARCRELHARSSAVIPPEVAAAFHPLFRWHPSEASGLLCLAALGYSGSAEIRDQGSPVELGVDAAHVYALTAAAVLASNRIAQALEGTESLQQAEEWVVRFRKTSEIEYERRKLDQLQQHPTPRGTLTAKDLLASLRPVTDAAQARGVRFVTMRRLAELLELNQEKLQDLRDALSLAGHQGYLGPALDVSVCP